MISIATTQVRLVRCPKCRKLLPEPPECPMYTCGGCGAILQAKNRKNGKSLSSGSLAKSTSQKNQLEHDSEYVKLTSSGQMENHCDKKEYSSNLNMKDCSIQPSGNGNLNGVSSGESECLSNLNAMEQLEDQSEHDSEDVKSTSSVPTENHCDKKNCSSDLNVTEQVEIFLGHSECSSDLNVKEQVEVSSGDSDFSSDLNAKEQIESTDFSMEKSESRDFLNGVSSGELLEQIKSGNCTIKQCESTGFLKGVSSSDLSCHEREEKSSEAGRNTQRDEHDESQSPDSQFSGGKSSSVSSPRQSNESNPTKMNFSPSNIQLEQSLENSHLGSDNTRSVETVEASRTTDNGKISEGLSGAPDGISKSPTARSSHAYDGSVSSFDGRDDKIPHQTSHLPKRSWFKRQVVAEFPSNKERPRREDGLMNKKIGNNPEVRHQGKKLLSMPSGEKHGLKWEGSRIQAQGQMGSPGSDGLHPRKNWMRSERDEFWSRESFQRGFPRVYENGSHSNYKQEEFPRRMSACSSKADYFEQLDLLRKLDELRDQLSRSYNQRGMANGRFSPRSPQQLKHQPQCHSYEQLDSKVPRCYDANYQRHPHAPYWPRQIGCQKCESSQMLFSGQGTNCRNHVGHSCYHCCPEDRQCRLPPSCAGRNKVPFKGHPPHSCYEPYGSSSATQQKHINSCFSQPRSRMHYQDQGFMDHDLQKKYYRDRRHPIKQHFKPIAGGAPFVICYRCSALLQLPKDFLSQKRIHQLQCSACLQVLQFSLQNRTHITPYNPNPVEPPQGDPVSYSEDCEPSTCKSCSTEGCDLPFPILQGNADDKELPSSSYSGERVQGKKKLVFKQCGNNYKIYSEDSESTRTSFEGDNCKAPRVSRSPLHQLLGYSSPGELIYGDGS